MKLATTSPTEYSLSLTHAECGALIANLFLIIARDTEATTPILVSVHDLLASALMEDGHLQKI